MKKRYLLLSALTVLAFSGVAQQDPTDLPENNVPVSSAKALPTSSPVVDINALTISESLLPCGGGTDTLVASGACSYVWSSDSTISNIVGTGDTLIYGPFTSDTSVYLTSYTADKDSSIVLPPQATTFSTNVRGYYFTSPVDMVITGLWIPTDASTSTQTVEVLRFDNQTPPPEYSLTTNAFTSLGYWLNYSATDTIDVCIPVFAGDVIGIYGYRGTTNSYGSGPASTTIAGITTALERSGMQFTLTTEQMHDVWSVAGGSISRIEFFYDITPVTDTSLINIVVPGPEASSVMANICQGDSIMVGGAYQTSAGMYYDTLATMYGCDSIVTTDLIVNQPEYMQDAAAICAGDSIMLGGSYQTTAGVYTDVLQTTLGCDSIVETTLSINDLPTISFVADTVCEQDGSVALSATPSGGTFSGTNVSGGMFDATAAGAGTHTITYDYTDNNGCSNSENAAFVVEDCAGIAENTLDGVKVFPNPMAEQLQIALPEHLASAKATLYDAKGRIVLAWDITSTVSNVNVSNISAGMYVVEVLDAGGLSAKFRVVKK